jgi:hypothetical protein
MLPSFALANGVISVPVNISGVPSSVSGTQRVEGQSINQLSSGANAAGRYVKERVDALPFTRPASDARDPNAASVNQAGQTGDQNGAQVVTGAPVIDPMQQQLAAPSGPIEYIIPEDMKLVSLNGNGRGVINGSKSGTYAIEAPALYFSTFTLPFTPIHKTPFPALSEIEIYDGVVMIAPKTVAPVNVVLFHPQKPSLSVSLVILPQSSKAPADIRIDFNPKSIPETKRQENKAGVVVDGHRIARIRKMDRAVVSEYERASSHTEALKKLNVDLAKGFVPNGYALDVISEGPSGVLCGDKRLVGTYVQNLIGEQFEADVFNIKNAGDEYVTFDEKKCYRSGVSSVQFNPSPILRPGSSAELIIIHTKTPVDMSDRVRRPSVVGGVE